MGPITHALTGLLFVLILAGGAIPAAGQRPDRGGDQRGGPGGMRGGPGGMRGGPGGMRGGRGGPDAMGFLARLDRNGNGMLDPDEAQGPARMMLDRVAGPANLDTSRPIPLEEINRAFQRMREERSEGFSRWGGRGDNDDSDNDDRGRGRGDDSQSSGSAVAESLVPGFGEPDLFDPVPGFGDLAERFAVRIQESDEQQAQRTMGRYDRNRDGVLDEEEIRRARGFRDDPLDTDRNRDGQLSMDELALRYALRRVAEEGSGGDSRTSRGRSSNARSDRSSGGDDDRTARMVDATMQRYDQNRSGVLEKDEWSRFRTDPSAADRNQDDKITRDELAAWMQERLGGGRSRGGSSNDADAGGAGGGAARWGDRTSYRTPTATERLPEGLPEWYARTDGNGDGQVMMSEYAVSWSQRVADDFAQFDLNQDGVITPQECLRAVEAGAVQGAPRPTTADSGSYSSRSRSPAANRSTSRPSDDAAPVTSSKPSTDQGSVSAKYVKYAVGLIRKYDSNQDGVLTKDEWSSMTKDYSSADTDQDGRLTPTELAAALVP